MENRLHGGEGRSLKLEEAAFQARVAASESRAGVGSAQVLYLGTDRRETRIQENQIFRMSLIWQGYQLLFPEDKEILGR